MSASSCWSVCSCAASSSCCDWAAASAAVALTSAVFAAVWAARSFACSRSATSRIVVGSAIVPPLGGRSGRDAGERAARLRVLTPHGVQDVRTPDRRALGRGEKACGDGRIADQRADDRVERGKLADVDVRVERRAGGEMTAPQLLPLLETRLVELDDELESPGERRIDVLPEVRRQDREPVEPFQARQQERGLEGRVAVVWGGESTRLDHRHRPIPDAVYCWEKKHTGLR